MKIARGTRLAFAVLMGAASLASVAYAVPIASPDGKIVVDFRLDDAGSPRYAITFENKAVLEDAPLGIVRDDADFTKGLTLKATSDKQTIRNEYDLATAKRRPIVQNAVGQTFSLATADGKSMQVAFVVANDGVGFRYILDNAADVTRKVSEERTTFRFPAGTRAWIQPNSVPKSGWARTNPSYEEHYLMDVPVGTRSPMNAGWVYPVLFRAGDTWVLLSEASPTRTYSVTRLDNVADDANAYRIALPSASEAFTGAPSLPEAAGTMTTPWRVIAIGSLKTIVESTLGTDLAEPAKPNIAPAKPGRSSWSWALLQDRATTYDVQRTFIDYAADMGWEYCLIDALWDKQIGYERTKELIDYAKTKNVGIILWYNSNGTWNDAPQTPRHMLLTREDRIKEFDRLEVMGVAGLKVDFFGGDGQSMVGYQMDLLEDAAPYGFAMNFHGTTLPRGWQRTYPNLLTAEAIKGQEFIVFEQANADKQPSHVAMLPFTRNVFDPMDFTPLVLDRFPNGRERRTTAGFELASTVLMTSGIQHFAEIPEGLAKAPPYVKQFLKDVPATWDDIRFIGGEPGESVFLARRHGDTWYVAGINATAQTQSVQLDLSELSIESTGSAILRGPDTEMKLAQEQITLDDSRLWTVGLEANDGFVATFRAKR